MRDLVRATLFFRPMPPSRHLLWLTVVALASCIANEPREPIIYRQKFAGAISKVTDEDIKVVIAIVRERCLRERRVSLPVYRVDIDFLDRIYVHCGPHYGVAQAPGALEFTLERQHGKWVITSISQYTPNPERVIVT